MDLIVNYGARNHWMHLALVVGFCESGSIKCRNFLISSTNASLQFIGVRPMLVR